MPYCSIVIQGDSNDLQTLENHMTVGLDTVEEIKNFAEWTAQGMTLVEDQPATIYILDMRVKQMPTDYDLDKQVPMPQMPALGRDVVEKYSFYKITNGA